MTFADPLKEYGIIVNVAGENGATPLPLKVEGTGTTDELLVATSWPASEAVQPEAGNVAAFGELDADGEFTEITSDFVITRISRVSNGFSLELQEYDEAMYDSGPIPDYKPLVNNTPTVEPGEIPLDAVTSEQLEERMDAANADTVQAAVDTITQGYRFSNVYQVRPVDLTLEDIIAKMDSDARDASASISISEDEILLQVQDMERELVGLIDVQAGAVTALVAGGGAVGQMSLTLNLPVMIDAAKRAQLIAASTEAKVNAVYAAVEGTDYYGIKGNASNAAVKALWDDAIAANLIASQIDLSATQIKVSAENVYIDSDVIVNQAKKIKATLIDVENILATNISVKGNGVIKSANYNGTISAAGVITAYGDAGWAIDHTGKSDFVNINATGGTFRDGFFSGLLDCDIFKIYKSYIETTEAEFTTSQAEDCYNYLHNKLGGDVELSGTVEQFWGTGRHLVLSGTIEIVRIRYRSNDGRNPSENLWGYDENDTEYHINSMSAPGVSPGFYWLYYDMRIFYRLEDATVMSIENLPIADPHIAGRCWNSGGTLKISQG